MISHQCIGPDWQKRGVCKDNRWSDVQAGPSGNSLTCDRSDFPVLCLYVPPKAQTSDPVRPPEVPDTVTVFNAPQAASQNPAWEALQACAKAHSGRDVVVLALDTELPPNWWPRLCSARHLHYDVVSPLSNAAADIDPFASGTAPSTVSDADACVFMLSGHEAVQSNLWLPGCALWRATALAKTESVAGYADGELPPTFQAALIDWLYVHSPQPMPRSNVAQLNTPGVVTALGLRIAALDGRIPKPAGRDNKPVLLHVLHGWGGGVQRFVEDLMQASTGYQHLALVAKGSSERRQTGERLELYDDLSAAPLLTCPLSSPISTTALASNEYHSVLSRIRAQYRVSQILVSSLIGHSLDLLRTGLPTAVVCHDYYPLWPKLHEDFGDPNTDFSASALPRALRNIERDFHFSERRPEAWQQLRETYVAALHAANATLIGPSQTVRQNLQRIEPRLGARRWQVIPHALAPWPNPVTAFTPPAREPLRVLVLGRINGGKGEVLLSQLIGKLGSGIELLLLGAGRAGMQFFGQSNVHVRLDYQHDELPVLIREFSPDLALIPVTVSETFSYTLSELWSLGVPVLATRLGSLAERIHDGENGMLVDATAEAVAAQLHVLHDDRTALEALRALHPQPPLEEMAAEYEAVMHPAEPAHWPTFDAADPIHANVRHALEWQTHTLSSELSAAHALVQQQEQELGRRGEWGDRLQGELSERTTWALSLQTEINTMNQELAKLWQKLEHNQLELAQSQTKLDDVSAQLAQNLSTLAERDYEVAELRDSLQAAMLHGDTMQHDRDVILASRSWRLTRPLRFANRLIAQLAARLKFRWQRLSSTCRRTLASLRSRGVNGTAARIRDELRPAKQSKPTALPVPGSSVITTDITLPSSDQPVASIVIPVYNQLDATLICLRSLAQTKNRIPHEIIIVDDCSSDASATVLPKINGLHYQRNPENLGFIGACNAGAKNARGEFVVFLNNDTAVQDGWLDALLDTFEQHRDVGLVGSKLVYPDGRLQEAGGIVFSDGSGWNYGRFDDPDDPRYNFVREVDYCSGAAIALRSELFRQFDGFDPHYAPAYYEDTDLAMKVRQAGLRVLYQPASVVVHFEGISSGTDTASGTKRYQVINQKKFLARWRDVLAQHPAPGTDIAIARQHRTNKHALVIDATTPQPDHDSGSVRLTNILRLLLEEGCAVTFFADNRAFVEGYSQALQQMGVEVLWQPFLSDPVSWFEANGKRLDLVFISRHYIASSYVDLVRTHAPKARLAFDTVDLHYLREQRAAKLSGSTEMARAAEKTRDKELALIRNSDITLVVSPVEKELLSQDAPGARVEVLSNVHEVFGRRRDFAERADIMFVGGYQHPPNVDAAIWFTNDILPLIRAELPDLRFHLIGSKAPAEVKALGKLPGVEFHGFVESIEPFLDDCRLAVAPLRYGAGVKGKVNMSMSYGQPVVGTPIATEGMFAEAGRDVLVAETPEDFAAQVVRAYRDEALWLQLSDNGLANVTRHFSFESARAAVRRLLDNGQTG